MNWEANTITVNGAKGRATSNSSTLRDVPINQHLEKQASGPHPEPTRSDVSSVPPSVSPDHPSDASASHESRPGYQFTTTHWSVVVSAGQAGSDAASTALERLCRAYWLPLFVYARRRGHNEEQAKDLTQAFFAQLIGRNYVSEANPELGRFRTFLLTSFRNFLANEWDRERAQKRGGGYDFISLEYAREQDAASSEPGHEMTPERLYEQRWAKTVLAQVLNRLRSEYDGPNVKRFDVLKTFLTEEKGARSYAEAARQLGLSLPALKSAVHRVRQRWRDLMREEIAHTVNATSSQEIDDEIRYLIQVLD